jgi:CheY-like chemotaxis protein
MAVQQHSETKITAAKSPGARVAPMRVLVADDERDTVSMLMAILRDEGHIVHGVFSGKDVLPAALLFRPDVLIVDIAIPGLSGYAVAQAVRHAYIEARRPLMIAISGFWKESPDRLVAEQVGFDHHLLKPCDSGHLLGLLRPRHSDNPLT